MVTYRRTRKPNAKFYIIIGVAAAVVLVVLILLLNVTTTTIEQGKIEYETEQAAVIVRDEQVFNAENYGKATFLASEGERVTEGAEIAEVYKWGYNDKIMDELLDVQTKIEQYQENNLLGDVIDQDLVAINESISEKSGEISQIISGTQEGDLLAEEKALEQLMTDKQAYLKEKVEPDTQLQDYYEQEAQLIERVDGWRETVSATGAGVVSFYFDGCEELLNADNIEKLTIKNINDIVNGSTLTEAVSTETERPLYRLVNNYEWYLLIVSSDAIQEFQTDNEFMIAFNEYVDKQYTGKVVGKREEESGYIYAIEINDDIGPLLNTRRTEANIGRVFEGLKVPTKSIKTVKEVKGVYVVQNKQKTFVPVKVLIDKGGFAIIEPVDKADTLKAGQQIEA